MKKTIAFALAIIMLLSSLCACNSEKSDEGDKNTDNSYNQDAENDIDVSEDNTNNNGDNIEFSIDPSDLIRGDKSIVITYDEYKKYYAYIKNWEAYFNLPAEFSNYNKEWPYYYSFVRDNVAWLIGIIRVDRDCELAKKQGHTMVIYKFDRDSKNIDIYTYICDTKEYYGELYEVYFGFYDDDHGYIFFWDEGDWTYGGSLIKSLLKTDDGGKTWYHPYDDSTVHLIQKGPEPLGATFVSYSVGAIWFKNELIDERRFPGPISITTDGGNTWKGITNLLPYPESLYAHSYSEIVDFKYINNEYFVYARVYGKHGLAIDVTFSSTDLESWKVINE